MANIVRPFSPGFGGVGFDERGKLVVPGGYAGAATVLAASAVAVPLTGTTDETVLATVTVPAGAMGPNGILRVTVSWGFDTSANSKVGRVRFGGLAGVIILSTGNITTNLFFRAQVELHNRGVTNSQGGGVGVNAYGGFGANNGALGTFALDTAVAQDIVFTGDHALAADVMRLEQYLVELITP